MARGTSRPEARLMPPLAGFDFPALRAALADLGADAWLLFDFRGVNPIASRVLDVHGMATRRFFVLLPTSGSPVAVAHRIELQAFEGFPGEVRPYAAWRELHAVLASLVRGKTLALEVSPLDAVPYLDRVPYGIVQLLESFGAHIVSSAPLVTQFAARWSAQELAGHRRAAEAIASIARDALAVQATPDGAACGLFAAAFAELLRLLVGFEGAMLHTACRSSGADRCEWRAAPPDPRHH